MSRWLGITVRLLGGAAILAGLLWRLGTGPFLDGLRAVDGWSLLAAAGLIVVTTVCGAWRWTIVARSLGVPLSLPNAVAASYRAQFLNTVLPGGVLGDVHRGVRHGRDVGDLPRALRAVAWERIAGQVVQALLTVLVLALLPSPVHDELPLVLAATAGAVLVLTLVLRYLARSGAGRIAGLLRTAGGDVRHGLLARSAWPGVLVASTVVVAGHVATFLIAAHVVGSSASVAQLLPIGLLVMLAMALPTNIGGWGPREGAAAWAFAAVGLGAAQGLAVATAYGVLTLVATLPGALVLFVGRRRVSAQRPPRPRAAAARTPVAAGGTARG